MEHQWRNSIPRELADALQNRETPEATRTIAWLAAHENDGELWDRIGDLLDDIERMAGER